MKPIGHEYIKQTRAYCDYLEEHFNNIAKAFDEVYSACKQLNFFIDDCNFHTLHREVELHDLDKFSKEEFTQYRDKFFSVEYSDEQEEEFQSAWTHHYMNNTHHWESATTRLDIVHMVIDWTAMSYKFGGTAQSYYEANLHKIKLQPDLIDFMYTIFNKLKDSHEHTNTNVTGTTI